MKRDDRAFETRESAVRIAILETQGQAGVHSRDAVDVDAMTRHIIRNLDHVTGVDATEPEPWSHITNDELNVLAYLGDAFSAFQKLPVLHPSDMHEFIHAIHAAQNIILARVGYRQQKQVDLSADLQRHVPEDPPANWSFPGREAIARAWNSKLLRVGLGNESFEPDQRKRAEAELASASEAWVPENLNESTIARLLLLEMAEDEQDNQEDQG